MDFTSRTVIITGASGNLGAALVHAFAQRSADLVLVDRNVERLQSKFGPEIGSKRYAAADLTSETDTRAVVRQALAWFSHVDVLCNVAGAFAAGSPVHETTDAMFERMFDANVRSMVNMARAVVPVMLKQQSGAIVNVAAYAAQKGVAGMGAYCASKAVVLRLSEAMAAELGDVNIRVNCVMPTTLDTPANRAEMPEADASKWVAPADLAETIVFLASNRANAVQGAALPVTGRS
jgi:NAD(P)-dependent dehydrogenase (short-subunit alcohol dehydrogenase family)